MPSRIGLDVGGTNTDAVLMTGREVIGWVKTPTTADVGTGIHEAIVELLAKCDGASAADVGSVMIGTTHFTNALVEKRRLSAVAAVRVCLPASSAIPIGAGWPRAMADAVRLESFMVHGGVNFDGNPIADVRRGELLDVAREIRAKGIESVAVCSVFSPVAPDVERAVVAILREELGDIDISLSSDIGRLGLLERENAAILNASMRQLARRTFAGFASALERAGLDAPLYISQNDGTVMGVEYAAMFPVRTLASGPTNSMRGAAFLSGLNDAVVVDIGGTTADAGALVRGFPREAAADLSIEGVRTNFRMPDVLSVGIGGGSVVERTQSGVSVGPMSVGYRIREEARVFGGEVLTATDVAVAAGLTSIGTHLCAVEPDLVESAVNTWHSELDALIGKARGSSERLPVVLVGGGVVIADPTRIQAADRCVVPPHSEVANAVGAAIPQVSGDVDHVVAFGAVGRGEVLRLCREEAVRNAVAAGADPATVTIVDEDVVTLNYLSEDSARVRVRAIGDIPFSSLDALSPSAS